MRVIEKQVQVLQEAEYKLLMIKTDLRLKDQLL